MVVDSHTMVMQVRRQFKLFAFIVGVAIVASVVNALLTRPVYRAEVVVGPVADDQLNGSGGVASQLGGLAALAGGLLGGNAHWKDSVALLHSRHLIESLVTRENLLPVLFPPQPSRLPWAGSGGRTRQPTMGDAVLLFQRQILQVREDLKTGLVTVRVEWFDPRLAAAWANELVTLADTELRASAVTDAQSSLVALQREFAKTDAVELRATIAHLIEAQLRANVVAGARAQFAYRIIDRAVPADLDKRVRPTRTLMVLVGTLAGVLIGVLVVMLRAARPWANITESAAVT